MKILEMLRCEHSGTIHLSVVGLGAVAIALDQAAQRPLRGGSYLRLIHLCVTQL